MRDDTGRRDARMMDAVAGMGGRSTLSSEVDLRLGVLPTKSAGAAGLVELVFRLRRSDRATLLNTAGRGERKKLARFFTS